MKSKLTELLIVIQSAAAIIVVSQAVSFSDPPDGPVRDVEKYLSRHAALLAALGVAAVCNSWVLWRLYRSHSAQGNSGTPTASPLH
jgi:hypothetical protein